MNNPICLLCKNLIFTEKHPISMFPCNHIFHLYCLLDSYTNKQLERKCPIEQDNNMDDETTESHLSILLNAKRSLNLGNNISDLHLDLKINIIQKIADKRYKSQLAKLQKIKELDKTIQPKVSLAPLKPFKDSKSKYKSSSYSDDQEFEQSEPIKQVIRSREDIVMIYQMRYTMKDIVESRIHISFLLENGYGMIDWLILQAKWKELLIIGLTPQIILDYHSMVDISSLIEMYNLGFHDIYELCEESISELNKLTLKKEDLNKLGINLDTLKKHKISIEQLKNCNLWPILTEEEWNGLLVCEDNNNANVVLSQKKKLK